MTIFWAKFFGQNFLGTFLGAKKLGKNFWGKYFGHIFGGKMFWAKFWRFSVHPAFYLGICDPDLGHHPRFRLPLHAHRLLQPQGPPGSLQTGEGGGPKAGVRRPLPLGTAGR
jgi:hypothetical protein